MITGAINNEGEKNRTMIFGVHKLLADTKYIRF